MTEAKYLTREEAAAVTGCSIDTLRRDQRMNKFPNVRTRRDGVVEIPVADLVAAGRLDPLAVDTPLAEIATKSRVERRVSIDYHVEVERHYYSVPYQLAGEVVDVRRSSGRTL
jgi:transposase